MINEVEPFLAERRNEGTFNSFDGRPISYEYYITENAKASVVISHGFTESAEKFREMSYYFINEGYNVFAITHRGHGASYKESIDPYTVYVSEFNDYIKDFYTFIKRIVTPNSDSLPLYLYAHSMGGAIAALTLEQYPDIFKKAVLNAPMIHFKSSPHSHGEGHNRNGGFSRQGQAPGYNDKAVRRKQNVRAEPRHEQGTF